MRIYNNGYPPYYSIWTKYCFAMCFKNVVIRLRHLVAFSVDSSRGICVKGNGNCTKARFDDDISLCNDKYSVSIINFKRTRIIIICRFVSLIVTDTMYRVSIELKKREWKFGDREMLLEHESIRVSKTD